MMKRMLAIVLFAAALLWLIGCAQSTAPEEDTPAVTATEITEKEPAELYTGVETDKKVVSIIFEGFSQPESMEKIVDLMDARNVECVFFLSGVTVSEQPELVKKIHDAGLPLGNYGMSGGKNMEANSEAVNLRQFARTQELFAQVCGSTPTLFRCNGSRYTREVLQAGAAAGLSAGVEPDFYLNHRSFATQTDAGTYVQRLVRGSIISVKLGQELDAFEYGQVVSVREMRPAIDPGPSISAAAGDIPRSVYEKLDVSLGWLLDALAYEGYAVVSPERLRKEAVDLFAEKESENAGELDETRYSQPLTPEPLTSPNTRPGVEADLRGSVFVGDSVMESLKGYVNWRRSGEDKYLDGVDFLTGPRLTVEGNLMRLGESSAHPMWNGTRMTVEDALRAANAKRIYLMLQCDDPLVYEGLHPLDNVKLLIYLIRKENPGAQICVVSYPPNRAAQGGTYSNSQLFRYNLEQCRLCRQLGIPYLDVASVLRDSTGMLAREYCMDEDTYGTDLSDAGCEAFLEYIIGHIPV